MILEVKIDLFCVEKGVNRMDREERWRAIPDKNSEYTSLYRENYVSCIMFLWLETNVSLCRAVGFSV